jgi:hypothetical protein
VELDAEIEEGVSKRLRGSLGTPEKMKRQPLGRFMANARKLGKFFDRTLEWGGEKGHRKQNNGLRQGRHAKCVSSMLANAELNDSAFRLLFVCKIVSDNGTDETLNGFLPLK